MTRRLFGLSGPPVERAEVVSRIALPSLREATAVLLKNPSPALRAAAALSPILQADPRAAPILRELAQQGSSPDSIALLARNPGASPDVAELCLRTCTEAEARAGSEWWHSRAWLAGLAGLAHLGHPAAIQQVELALDTWESDTRDRWVDGEGIGLALLALSAMGPRLRQSARLCRRLEGLQEIPLAAFPLAASGDRLALRQLATHPDTAQLALAFPPALAAEALSRGLTVSEAGLQTLRMMMAHDLAPTTTRALVEQAAAVVIGGESDEVAARIVRHGISALPAGWLAPLLAAEAPAPIRRHILAALARRSWAGAPQALAGLLRHPADPDWVVLLPPELPGVAAVIQRVCASLSADSPAHLRAMRTRLLLSLPEPPPSLVAAQLRYGRPEAIEAALRLPQAAVLLADALRRRRIWRNDAAVYRFRKAFAAAVDAQSALLRVLAADRDLRVSMFADEALRGVPVPAPVDHACPGTQGWLSDFRTQGYLQQAA